jgi:glycosyltransferase involved in cell wall biosynthesis
MNTKPKLLIIADQPHWAYHNIQLFIKKHFSNQLDIYTDFIIFNSNENIHLLPHHFLKHKIDELRYRKVSSTHKYDLVLYLGVYFKELMKSTFRTDKVIMGIYTDGFPPQSLSNLTANTTKAEFINLYLSDTDLLVCGSQKICDFYMEVFPNTFYANVAFDERLFCGRKGIGMNHTSKFHIGWTGNPKREFKGFYDIVIPAVEEAKKQRPGIDLKARFSGPIKSLPKFYKDIDVVLIASDKDAGPSLFMEASLMNVPAISTRIGMPNEVIIDGENGMFCERDIASFVNSIIKLYDDRELLYRMSGRIRNDAIKQLGVGVSVERWTKVFQQLELI